jgi:hypothetical protein
MLVSFAKAASFSELAALPRSAARVEQQTARVQRSSGSIGSQQTTFFAADGQQNGSKTPAP